MEVVLPVAALQGSGQLEGLRHGQGAARRELIAAHALHQAHIIGHIHPQGVPVPGDTSEKPGSLPRFSGNWAEGAPFWARMPGSSNSGTMVLTPFRVSPAPDCPPAPPPGCCRRKDHRAPGRSAPARRKRAGCSLRPHLIPFCTTYNPQLMGMRLSYSGRMR